MLGASAVANFLLGRYLLSVGERVDSVALKADGRHVLADVWTSVGVIGGLLIVHLTGWTWADPLIAMAVAINLAREGFKVIQESLRGLMDEADPGVIEAAAKRLERSRQPTWIDLHGLRSWSSGARRHFDLHISVPRYFDVEQIHAIHDDVERALIGNDPGKAEPSECRRRRHSLRCVRRNIVSFLCRFGLPYPRCGIRGGDSLQRPERGSDRRGP